MPDRLEGPDRFEGVSAGAEGWSFAAYEVVRDRVPVADFSGVASRRVAHLGEVAADYDVFLLDAYGVLNVGEDPIPGVPERVADLQAQGKRVMVVTNSAGYPKSHLLARYARFGFRFDPDDVVSSRGTMLAALEGMPPRRWGLMAEERYGTDEIGHLDHVFLGDDPAAYDAVEGFLLIGSGGWSEPRHALMEASLAARPRPVFCANPDLSAPLGAWLSREPGFYAHRLADTAGAAPGFYGKPFANIFARALARVPAEVPRHRILMVGDTLQTDILGGRAAGISTALVTGHGSLAGADVDSAIAKSGIVPDVIMPTP
ncbi:TIGR01459 family HAD-type hydrolase [Acidimangrovimonas sediminis]|uniref:TIGR01459 family HAD-type hydrolase n=1 Tax=Acidimangrovimonas sediminis TaxID=2056283 RepID=UPI000C80FC79|nr:TIGR01459 family HAD-type hydrolase [Acidimangrovimonas sediminis]